jgi:hypothetical protein
MRSFQVHGDGGRFVIKSDHSDEFITRAEPDTDAAAAQRDVRCPERRFSNGLQCGRG